MPGSNAMNGRPGARNLQSYNETIHKPTGEKEYE